MDSDAGTDRSEAAHVNRASLTGRVRRRWFAAAVAVVGGLAVGLPLSASLAYRSAVHRLHAELAPVRIDSADIVDVRIEPCWNGAAPASVRVLMPSGGQTLSDVVADYVDALEPLGFEASGGVIGSVASRSRLDDLDDDVISVSLDDTNRRAMLIADPSDADMVICLPL